VSETQEPGRRADAILLKGEILTHEHSARASYELCVREAETVLAADRRRAVLLLASAAGVGAFFGSVPLSLAAARRAYEIAARDGADQEFCSSFILGRTLTLAGEPGGASLLERAADIARNGPLGLPPEIASWAGTNWMHHKSGLQVLLHAIADARDHGAVGNLPFLLRQLGAHEHADSHYEAAFAAAMEGLELARDCGEYSQELHLLVLLVELTADLGQEAKCRAYAEDAYTLAARLDLAWRRAAVTLALGRLELGLGCASSAVGLLEDGVRDLDNQGFYGTNWYPAVDLTEAYLRVRRREAAEEVVKELLRRRRRAAAPKTGTEAHCCGLVSDDQSFEPFLLDAIGQTDGEPFWQARAQLALGARLRRARRRIDARKSLRAAHATFEYIGAQAWAEQVRSELSATGETARRRIPATLNELTSQELRIAIEVANGGTNRAVAARLFISPKTVEHHLAQVYRKLAVGSRNELRSQLTESHRLPSTPADSARTVPR
jgi:DNA-binding CsgD family transcriptional regulator